MKKFGFTIAEILITLAIIGIITGFAVNIFKPFDKGYKYLFSNTYYSLDKALYNAVQSYIPENIYTREPFLERVTNPENNSISTISEQEGAERLCNALTEYINTVETHCDLNPPGDLGSDAIFSGTPFFVATNGIRFWISRRFPGNGDEQNRTKFFIIYADLNGPKPPNSMRYEEGNGSDQFKTRDPDVFAFAALQTGRICPIGVPEVESRYLTTRTRYLDEELNSVYSPVSSPMIYTMAESWGYYISENEGDDNIPIPESPLSYNGYLRSIIDSSSEIYSFLDGRSMRAYFDSRYPEGNKPTLNNTPVADGGFGCIEKSDDECEVIVDKYVY